MSNFCTVICTSYWREWLCLSARWFGPWKQRPYKSILNAPHLLHSAYTHTHTHTHRHNFGHFRYLVNVCWMKMKAKFWLLFLLLFCHCCYHRMVLCFSPLLLFFFSVLGFELKAYTLSHSISPFFCDCFFLDRVSKTICPSWLRTAILLISASSGS
jgi:hypothetical protein